MEKFKQLKRSVSVEVSHVEFVQAPNNSQTEGNETTHMTQSQSALSAGSSASSAPEAEIPAKKPRKFRPAKFISKTFRSASSRDLKILEAPESEELRTHSAASLGSSVNYKLSPNMKRIKKSLVKTFSLKKKHKALPENELQSNLEQMAGLALSETTIVEFEEVPESPTLENKEIKKLEEIKETVEKPQELAGDSKSLQNVSTAPQHQLHQLHNLKSQYTGTKPKIYVRTEEYHVKNRPPPPPYRAPPAVKFLAKLESQPPYSTPIIRNTLTTFEKPLAETTKNSSKAESTDLSSDLEMDTADPINEATADRSSIGSKPVILETFAKQDRNVEAVEEIVSTKTEALVQELLLTSLLTSGIAQIPETLEVIPNIPDTPIFLEQAHKEEEVTENFENFEEANDFEEPMGKKPRKNSDSKVLEPLQNTIRTQEAHKPYHVNLNQPSTSSSDLQEKLLVPAVAMEDQDDELKPADIKFNIGTPVRPQRTSSSSSVPPLPQSSQELSDDSNSFHSPLGEPGESKSETFRRRIAYVPQLTIYSPEEEEILQDLSRREASADSLLDSMDIKFPDSMFPEFDSLAVRVS